MRLLKRIGRILVITIFVILASFGLGIFNLNLRFMHKENQIELVERKDDEEDSESKEFKE